MSWSVAILGDFRFPADPAGGFERWQASITDPHSEPNWPHRWAHLRPEEPLAVAQVWEALAQAECAVLSRVANQVAIRVLADKDSELWRSHRRNLVAALRGAAAFGASGMVYLLRWKDGPPDLAHRVVLSPFGPAILEELSPEEARAVEASPLYQELEVLRDQQLKELLPFDEATLASWTEDALATLGLASPAAVVEAARSLDLAWVGGDLVTRLQQVSGDASAFLALLAPSNSTLRNSERQALQPLALRLLTRVDAAKAVILARKTLTRQRPALWLDAALEALALHDSPLSDSRFAEILETLPSLGDPMLRWFPFENSVALTALGGHLTPSRVAALRTALDQLIGSSDPSQFVSLSPAQGSQAMVLARLLLINGDPQDRRRVIDLELEHPTLQNPEGALRRCPDETEDALADGLARGVIPTPSAYQYRAARAALARRTPAWVRERLTHSLQQLIIQHDGHPPVSDPLGPTWEAIRWIASDLPTFPEGLATPWTDWLSETYSNIPKDEAYSEIYGAVLVAMATARLPETGRAVEERYAKLGPDSACQILECLGDPSRVSFLENKAQRARSKAERSRLAQAIKRLTGLSAEHLAQAPTHQVELAPSGRASCRVCKDKIGKGELRFAEAYQNQFSGPGDTNYRYYHLRCAAQDRPRIFVTALAAFPGTVPDRAALTDLAEPGRLPIDAPHGTSSPSEQSPVTLPPADLRPNPARSRGKLRRPR